MKTYLIRGIALCLALSCSALVLEAQRGNSGSSSNSCTASGVRCFFGSAAGCSVTCDDGVPLCKGARCILGFPVASECTCVLDGIS